MAPASNPLQTTSTDNQTIRPSQVHVETNTLHGCYSRIKSWLEVEGTPEQKKLVQSGRFELVVGLIDFVTDMVYFATVLHIKISDDEVAAGAMRAFLFITSTLGLMASYKIHRECFNGVHPVDPIDFPTGVYTRTWFEDMPQIVITLVIERYRIKIGATDSLSKEAVATIVASVIMMMKANLAMFQAGFGPNHRYSCGEEELAAFIALNALNVLPVIITAWVLYG